MLDVFFNLDPASGCIPAIRVSEKENDEDGGEKGRWNDPGPSWTPTRDSYEPAQKIDEDREKKRDEDDQRSRYRNH